MLCYDYDYVEIPEPLGALRLRKMVGRASTVGALWPLNNKLPRAAVTKYEVLFSDWRQACSAMITTMWRSGFIFQSAIAAMHENQASLGGGGSPLERLTEGSGTF